MLEGDVTQLVVAVAEAVQAHLLVVVQVVVRNRDVVGALLYVYHSVEGRVARALARGERREQLVVIDPDVLRRASAHALDRHDVGRIATWREPNGHVADEHVARTRRNVDAEIGARAVFTQKSDVTL